MIVDHSVYLVHQKITAVSGAVSLSLYPCYSYCPTDFFQCFANATNSETGNSTAENITSTPDTDCGAFNYNKSTAVPCGADEHPEHAHVACQGCYGTAFGIGGGKLHYSNKHTL